MFSVPVKPLAVFLLIAGTMLYVQKGTVVAQSKTQKISKKLVERAEDMVKEIEKTQKQLEKTTKKYNQIFEKKKVKDRQKEHKDLNKEIKNTENRVKEVRKRSEDMQKEADKFFDEWSKGLTKIQDAELRGMSQSNMTESRDRYSEIIESGLRAGGLYDSFLTALKNQGSYFELDMSDGAMAKLTTNRSETKAKAKALNQSIEDLTKATKSYISSMK